MAPAAPSRSITNLKQIGAYFALYSIACPESSRELRLSLKRFAYLLLLAGFVLRLWIVLTKPEVLWIDDSFYSLGIARNIAQGLGWTHDGLHLTNGFQPLYVFLMIPVYWLLPPQGLLIPTLVLLFQAVISVATGWLLFRLIRQRIGNRSAILILGIWSFSPYVINGVNALETPFVPFGIALLVYLYLQRWRDHFIHDFKVRSGLFMGIGLGLLMLTRVDSAFFAMLILLDLAYRLLKQHIAWRAILWPLGLIAFTSLALVGLWFLLSYANTGRINFDSGTATRLRSIASYEGPSIAYTHFAWVRGILNDYVASPIFPWLALLNNEIFLGLSVIFTGGLSFWAWRCSPAALRRKLRAACADFAFLLLLMIVLPAAYVLYQYTVWMWSRYFYSLLPAFLILFAIAVEPVLHLLDGLGRRAMQLGGAAGLIAYSVLLPVSQPADVNPILGTPADKDTAAQFAALDWLQAHAEPDSRAAAFQSGILAYFAPLPVINLDGVVNAEALPYYVSGDILDYIEQQHIRYLADWRFFTGGLDFDRLQNHHARLLATFPAEASADGTDHSVDLYQFIAQ